MRPQQRYFLRAGNYWIALLHDLLNPLWKLLLQLGSMPPKSPPSSWRRGLLMGANHIGDVLYLTPSLPKLKELLPDCEWDICVSPPAHEVLLNNPNLNSVIALPHERDLSGVWGLRSALLGKNYDVVICYDHGRAWKDLLLAISLKIPNRVGYEFKGFGSWLTLRLGAPDPYPQSCAGMIRDLVSKLSMHLGRPCQDSSHGSANWDLTPKIYFTDEDEQKAQQLWEELAIPPGKDVFLCFATSRQTIGVWPSLHILGTIKEFTKLRSGTIIWGGAQVDEKIIRKMQDGLGANSLRIDGRLNLRELCCFMRKCRAVITPDSGPRHLANAAGVPVFFFRNVWFHKLVAGVYCSNEIDLAEDHHSLDPEDAEQIWQHYPPKQLAKKITECLS